MRPEVQALSLAFTTEAAAIFINEPVSHLDRNGRQWYGALLEQWRRGRTLIVASNHNAEELEPALRAWNWGPDPSIFIGYNRFVFRVIELSCLRFFPGKIEPVRDSGA